MRLFLIRHGESVDNVAGLYAGSRDSSLTAHGALQAGRLASSLARSCAMTHIFSSPLQRAAKTAEAVCDAQNRVHGAASLGVTLVSNLREKDFGSLEGVSFRRVKPACHDAETAQSLRVRVGHFWDEHMAPLLRGEVEARTEATCAIVAHGILLRALASHLLDAHSSPNATLPPASDRDDLVADGRLSGLPSWSNTGYLEVLISPRPSSFSRSAPSQADANLPSWQLRFERVNCTSHLDSLKKTRGGIGSAPFDERQRTMSHFFTTQPKSRSDAS